MRRRDYSYLNFFQGVRGIGPPRSASVMRSTLLSKPGPLTYLACSEGGGMTASSSNLALLIDVDNISSKIIAGLMAEIANYGTASVRRIYGDWTSSTMKGWKHAC